MEISWSDIVELATKEGLLLVGVAPIASLVKQRSALSIWQESGFAGEMGFMNRSPDLFIDPKHLLPNAQSILSFALPYAYQKVEPAPLGFGRVARYAWGDDYHRVIPKLLTKIVQGLQQKFPTLSARTFSDAVPLLERAAGEGAGLGFIGKNTLLIRPKKGSFLFLGEIILDAHIVDYPETEKFRGCGSCERCLKLCPTNAFAAPYVLDARRCISYLTIEKRGMLTVEERGMIGDWIFGCDICQEVCPFNAASFKSEREIIEEFSLQLHGPHLEIESILKIASPAEYRARFGNSALMRAKREGLVRNAMVVAVNRRYDALLPWVRIRSVEDTSPVVRATALWARAELGDEKSFIDKALTDDSEIVQHEARRILHGDDDGGVFSRA